MDNKTVSNTTVRAKFKMVSVTQTEYGEAWNLSAVSSDSFGPNGESEDNTYSRWTPTANLEMLVTNPELFGKFKPGEKFYLDFTKAKN